MHTQSIYREVEKVCDQRGRKLPLEWRSEIRQTLQAHCRGSKQWNGRDDFFVSHRRGYWSCKVTLPQAEVESGAGRGEAISLNSKESFGKRAQMPAAKETDVGAAFELVIEALANVQKTINEKGAKAFREGSHSEVELLNNKARKMADFVKRAGALQDEWFNTVDADAVTEERGESAESSLLNLIYEL